MSTFTVYCHGTGFNRIKGSESDELVAWFHNNTDGIEATLDTNGSYLINEGPGHGGNDIVQPQNVNPITGSNRKNRSLVKRIFTKPSFKEHLHGKNTGPKNLAQIKGSITGQGWDENVVRTVNIIQELKFGHGQNIDRVNMVGWSRGAVTCIRIANHMHKVFGSSIECNIFAVDPVAGSDAGKKMQDTQVLQSNVKNYIGILAMHEMRKTFSPQDWSRVGIDPAETSAIMLPMPGVHNAQVIPNNPAESAYITRNLACGFLNSLGTPVSKVPYSDLSKPLNMCIAYAKLVNSLSEHRSYQTKGIVNRAVGTGLRRRNFAKHSKMDNYTRGGKESYWINEHHRACFAAAFPGVYQLVFESTGSGEMGLTAKSRFSSFYNILKLDTSLRNSLIAKGLLNVESQDKYFIGIGAGRYADHMCVQWPDNFPLHA